MMMFGEWQSPETAPKDGTLFLGYGSWCRGSGIMAIATIEWRKLADKEEFAPNGDGTYSKTVETGRGGWTSCDFELMAWMPLPAPPEGQPAPVEFHVEPSSFVSQEAKL